MAQSPNDSLLPRSLLARFLRSNLEEVITPYNGWKPWVIQGDLSYAPCASDVPSFLARMGRLRGPRGS